VPIEVLRFGVGHRRPDGPPGTRGIAGRVIHSDARGVVSELAFARNAGMEPHSSPNTTYFIVIEGGGWVAVGGERVRVAAGEAIVWSAGIDHAAWTELSEMRAFVVEFSGPDDAAVRGVLDGMGRRVGPGEAGRVERGEGRLVSPPRRPEDVDRSSGEPL